MRRIVWNALCLSIVLASNVRADQPTTRPAYAAVERGIERVEMTTRTLPDAQPMRVWIYRPAAAVPASTWPCVFVAPGGSTGTAGVVIDEADVAEHLIYVKQGCVVVAFDLDGAARGRPRDADEAIALTRAFVRADGGLANLRAALALAKEVEPSIDATRLYIVGHDSGGTLALRAATTMPEVRGIVAYAPIIDPFVAIDAERVEMIDRAVPGLKAMLERSPAALVEKIRVPVMLVGTADVRGFAEKMKTSGNEALVVEGGAVMEDGLKAGASWIADRAKRDARSNATTRPS
jgi:dipeptidyl aminopeptidase/acylaminoacyl peptidase